MKLTVCASSTGRLMPISVIAEYCHYKLSQLATLAARSLTFGPLNATLT